MAQTGNVRESNVIENIVCMAITYHCMEYDQRLKGNLLGEFNRTVRDLQCAIAEMRTYDNIGFLELRCESSTDFLERSVLTVRCRNDRIQILDYSQPSERL